MLNFRKAYEFEKGKGAGNSDTGKQFGRVDEDQVVDKSDLLCYIVLKFCM